GEAAMEGLCQYLAEQTGWKYLKSRRCLKKTVEDLVFELRFYSSKWNLSFQRVEVECELQIWSRKIDKVCNTHSSVGFYRFNPPSGDWWDISTEGSLSVVREQLNAAITTHAVKLCREFETDYLEATKKLMDDAVFDLYHIQLSFVASQLGNEFIAEKAKEIYRSLNTGLRKQVEDYRQGDRSMAWMINPNNLKYIVDNGLV
ncbi:MAG: hypothetical protein K2O34_05970, partial [Acetatifactor sp.]|nr:hypothetical protein [Acetatifactor sp.]